MEWIYFFNKKNNLVDALKQTQICSGFTKHQIRKIAEIAHVRSFRDQELIFRKGDPSHGLYIVLTGKVEVFLQKKDQSQVLANYEPFQYFGELALLKDNTRKASAKAIGATKLCYLYREDLRRLFLAHPTIGRDTYEFFLGLLVERLDFANEQLMKK